MDLQVYITGFVALFVIIDPVGLTPLFASLTQGQSAKARFKIATRALVISFFLLTLFGLIGDSILTFLGISMSAFRIAGGMLLFLTALEMLFAKRTKRREENTSASDFEDREDPSVFPLATPLIAGPGSFTTMILLMDQTSSFQDMIMVELVMLSVLVIAMACFAVTSTLEKLLGPTGINVVTKIMGMLLAALSVQFVLDGITASFFT